jgi:hypothetical protein
MEPGPEPRRTPARSPLLQNAVCNGAAPTEAISRKVRQRFVILSNREQLSAAKPAAASLAPKQLDRPFLPLWLPLLYTVLDHGGLLAFRGPGPGVFPHRRGRFFINTHTLPHRLLFVYIFVVKYLQR